MQRGLRVTSANILIMILSKSDTESIFVVHSSKPQIKRKLFARLKVGESLIRFQLDSGATVCILSEDLAKQALGVNYILRPADAVLRMFDNTVLKTVGMITTKIVNPKTNEQFVVDFYIAKSHQQPILDF